MATKKRKPTIRKTTKARFKVTKDGKPVAAAAGQVFTCPGDDCKSLTVIVGRRVADKLIVKV
jgi:hypothetical protein